MKLNVTIFIELSKNRQFFRLTRYKIVGYFIQMSTGQGIYLTPDLQGSSHRVRQYRKKYI